MASISAWTFTTTSRATAAQRYSARQSHIDDKRARHDSLAWSAASPVCLCCSSRRAARDCAAADLGRRIARALRSRLGLLPATPGAARLCDRRDRRAELLRDREAMAVAPGVARAIDSVAEGSRREDGCPRRRLRRAD